MLRSTVFLLLLAVVAADGTAVHHLKEACGKTPHEKVCVSVLSAAPESETADARGLALLAIRAAGKMAAAASAAADAEQYFADEVNTHEEYSPCTAAAKARRCFSYCGGGFKVAVWMFTNATDDATRLVTSRLYFQLDRVKPYRAWDCGRCHVVGAGRVKPRVLAKGSDTEKFMEVASELVRLAPGGADPLPPLPDNVYGFLNWIDEQYVHMPDECREEKEPTPPKPPAM